MHCHLVEIERRSGPLRHFGKHLKVFIVLQNFEPTFWKFFMFLVNSKRPNIEKYSSHVATLKVTEYSCVSTSWCDSANRTIVCTTIIVPCLTYVMKVYSGPLFWANFHSKTDVTFNWRLGLYFMYVLFFTLLFHASMCDSRSYFVHFCDERPTYLPT